PSEFLQLTLIENLYRHDRCFSVLNAHNFYFQITLGPKFSILKALADDPGDVGNLGWKHQIVMSSLIYKMNPHRLSRQSGEAQRLIVKIYVCAFQPGSHVVNSNQKKSVG